MSRDTLAVRSQETVAALGAGYYTMPEGTRVSLREFLEDSLRQTRLIAPGQWRAIVNMGAATPRVDAAPTLEVTAETTLEAARRLVAQHGPATTMALNFASARNPGGGFLNGSRAQEESLARTSGLYPTLLAAQEYYTENRACRTTLYTDHAILSPLVPVFRDDEGRWLAEPYLLNIITMPAPNRRAMHEDAPDIGAIPETFRRRIRQILALSVQMHCEVLILGAWGCGAFRNPPAEVAAIFTEVLYGEERWAYCFRHLCFAIYDTSAEAEIRTTFEEHLRPYMKP